MGWSGGEGRRANETAASARTTGKNLEIVGRAVVAGATRAASVCTYVNAFAGERGPASACPAAFRPSRYWLAAAHRCDGRDERALGRSRSGVGLRLRARARSAVLHEGREERTRSSSRCAQITSSKTRGNRSPARRQHDSQRGRLRRPGRRRAPLFPPPDQWRLTSSRSILRASRMREERVDGHYKESDSASLFRR